MQIDTKLQIELLKDIEKLIDSGSGSIEIAVFRNGYAHWVKLAVTPLEKEYFSHDDLYIGLSNQQ